MPTEPSRVIIVTGATTHDTQAYHHDLPEIRGEGSSPADAATHLGNQLTRALDSALTDWRRQTLTAAIADVETFIAASS